MKSQTHLSACLLLLLSATALAQDIPSGGTARNIALGGGPANPYLEDLLRIHINPSLLASYGERVWGDLGFLVADGAQGGSRGQYLSAAFRLTESNTLGIALNRRESPLYNTDGSNPPRDPIQEMNSLVASILGIGAQPFPRPLSPVEVFWALRTAGVDLGASVSYGRAAGSRSGNAASEQSVSTLRAKLGIAAAIEHGVSIDAGAIVGLNTVGGTSASATGQQNELRMTDGMEFGTDARLVIPLNERCMLVPIGRLYSFTWGMKQVRNGTLVIPDPAAEYSHSELELGIGTRLSRNNILFVGGVSYQRTSMVSDSRTTKTTVVISDIPKINLGVEISIASWLVGRLGYFDRLASTETTVESASGKNTTTISSELPWYGDLNGLTALQQRITLGIGVHVAGMSIDATVGEGYFLNGPWPVSGVAQAVFSMISLSYAVD